MAQIARTIARGLNLNEDLAEAIALAHDIGHPPFGHAGEEALADLLPDGFRHAQQSLRVVEILERLNLTWETRDGIVKSSKVREDIFAEGWGVPATLEGQIVKIADAVAYINHDIADSLRAGVITEVEQLPDGRYTLVLQGLVKFRIAGEDQSRPYRLARVEPMPETLNDEDSAALR